MIYSYLNASTGFVLEALYDGIAPEKEPIKKPNNKQPIIKYVGEDTLNKLVPK